MFTISKIRENSSVADSFLSVLIFPIVFIFKNERVTAIPTNPYFLPKMAEHDVTLMSLKSHNRHIIGVKFSFGQHVQN